jgi:hypothetical protein
MVPIDRVEASDVFVVGYPKSGNTWVQTLTAGLIYGLEPERLPGRLVHGLVPDVHLWKYYTRWQSPMVFKSHRLPRREYRRVVYLIRDGRDALCSLAQHRRALGQEVDFLRMVESGVGLTGGKKWHEHVEAWLANPFDADLITITYERLVSDPVEELTRFSEFLGLDRTAGSIERVAASARFENMRRQEEAFGWPGWPREQFFVRRGKVGGYRDEMPRQVLEAFEREAGPLLRRLGYSTNETDVRPRELRREANVPLAGSGT